MTNHVTCHVTDLNDLPVVARHPATAATKVHAPPPRRALADQLCFVVLVKGQHRLAVTLVVADGTDTWQIFRCFPILEWC